MFFWNSFAFSMIQQMLAICSLVPLPFLNSASSSGSSWFTYCWSLDWRILSHTYLELGNFPWGGNGNSLPYSCLENLHGQRSLVGYSPWGCRELYMTEQLSTAQHSTATFLINSSFAITKISSLILTIVLSCSLLV